jgi:hypothetical protein
MGKRSRLNSARLGNATAAVSACPSAAYVTNATRETSTGAVLNTAELTMLSSWLRAVWTTPRGVAGGAERGGSKTLDTWQQVLRRTPRARLVTNTHPGRR